jgi:hypothetical protein
VVTEEVSTASSSLWQEYKECFK